MLFLITEKQKNKILNDYYASLINILSVSSLILFLLFMISLFPTYFLFKADNDMVNQKIKNLQSEIDLYKLYDVKNQTSNINNDISLLSLNVDRKTVEIYRDILSIYKSVPNVNIVNISVNSINKKITVNAIIDNKNTANIIIDKLNESKYKGAELPYSVFSQSKSFSFNQNLSYE